MEATVTAPASEIPDEAEETFERLYRASRDDVYAYAAGLLRDRSAAEEVTSVAFERAYRRRRQFDPQRGSHRAWLFGIARNAALDELRRRKRIAEAGPEPLPAAGADPGEDAVRRATVRTAMRKLDARERELVALRFFAGLSAAETAKVIGTSESNASTKLHRTIEKLRRACDEAE
jgi:RNA polymerase sigma-70 factor (ECF subfamily)